MNKTISVNPSFFNISKKNKTRKAKSDEPNAIKFKPRPPKTNKMVKKTILKFIRNKQQQRYNDTHDPHKPESRTHEPHADPTSDSVIPPPPTPPSEFEESLKYLTDIANETKPPQNNATLKKTTGYAKNNEHLFNSYIGTGTETTHSTDGVKDPPYGCLKERAGGVKPTYRQYVRNTIKTHPSITETPIPSWHNHPLPRQPHPQPQPPYIQQSIHTPQPIQQQPYPQLQPVGESPPIYKYRNIIDRTEELVKLKNKHMESLKPSNRRKKRKVIKNRTFKTGKRRNTLSVLLPTKTKRNETLSRTRDLKTVPLNEIKKELVKQGLIRVGTTTPPEVLRKMYESMKLICGNVKNHNPENLLYNFINDDT